MTSSPYLAIGEASTTLCVGNLPDYMSRREFRLMFKFATGVERCVINRTKKGHQVGYARFATLQDAQAAIEWLNGFPLDEDFPEVMKVFMSSTQLRDALATTGVKRPLEGGYGAPAAKFPRITAGRGMGKGLGMGLGGFGGYGGGFGMGRGFGFPRPMGMGMGMPLGMGMGMGMMGGFGMFGGKGFGKGKGKGKGAASPNSVYIGGIPHEWDESVLQSLFSTFGTITKVNITRGSNPVGNIGFVYFTAPTEAQAAISNMNNYVLDGTRHLVVRANTSSPRF